MKNCYSYQTKLGELYIISEGDDIVGVKFSSPSRLCDGGVRKETPAIREAYRQLSEYLEGRRKVFDFPLKPSGTEFQMKVWEALQTIPYGQRWSYKRIAEAVGNPKASRAVGMANNRNPIAVVVPCHRVVGANGKLVGYAGGLDKKELLLELEDRNK